MKNLEENEFHLLSDEIIIDSQDNDETIIEFLNKHYYNEEKKKIFNNYFYPNNNTNLQISDFLSIGIFENINYFTYYMDEKFKPTVESINSNIKYWRKIKGDGNCYFRAVLINYLEITIIKSIDNHKIFFALIKDFYFTDLTETSKKKEKFKNNTLLVLLSIYEKILNKDINMSFDILYRSYNKSDIVEKTLILWLRIKLTNFLKNNLDLEFNGIKLVQLIPGFELEDDMNYDKIKVFKYIDTELIKMNEFAEGYPLYITPIILGININIYYIDENASYKAIPIDISYNSEMFDKINNTNNYLWKFSEKLEIYLLFRVPHYDLIYKEDFVSHIKKFYINDIFLEEGIYNNDEYNDYRNGNEIRFSKEKKEKNVITQLFDDMKINDINAFDGEKKSKMDIFKNTHCSLCNRNDIVYIFTCHCFCFKCFDEIITTKYGIIKSIKELKIKNCLIKSCNSVLKPDEFIRNFENYLKYEKICDKCNSNIFVKFTSHNCTVCKYCTRNSIKNINKGKIIIIDKKNNVRLNKCINCSKYIQIDELNNIFTIEELKMNKINDRN